MSLQIHTSQQPSFSQNGPSRGRVAPFLLTGALTCLLPGMSEPVRAQSAPAAQPFVAKHIYSETAKPGVDIAAALAAAKRGHKRVILDFGGDWCGDCQVLDIYFHQSPNAQLLAK